MADLFESLRLGGTVSLKNRIVMAPMTRTRTSEGDIPNMLMGRLIGGSEVCSEEKLPACPPFLRTRIP